MFRDYLYRFEYDFARNNGGTQGITDAYLQYIRIPNWAITVGQQNEGKGLESYMSNNYLTFVERSLPSNAFIEQGANSKYQLGATAETWNEVYNMPYYFRGGITTESIGAPGPGNSSDNSQGGSNASGGNNPSGTNINRNAFSGDTSYQVVGRAGFDPLYEKGHHLLHTGVWGSWRSINNNYNADGTVRTGGWAYQSQPDTNVDRTNWINTGDLTNVTCTGAVNAAGVCSTGKFKRLHEVNNIAMFGAELAGSYGPVHFTAEYMQAQIAGLGYTGSDTLQGFYTQAGWFITGENRTWDVGKAYRKNVWERVIPKQNFMEGDGWGAFEVAARYDLMDMNTLHINGGSLDIGTLGFNWYFNPRVSLMTNWVHVFATNNGSALQASGGCKFPAQGANASIGCFNGLSPNVWETRVRMDF